ncbi:MAG: HAMP domain-containing histidine kinase [Lachnospiraceae bacterium]|nr:HAMP domain-containing histidine kinase [Lachnospiraceae bacterium]
MKNRLSGKFLLAYLGFGLGVFLLVAVWGGRLFQNSARRTAAEELYRQAVGIADEQSEYYASKQQLNLGELSRFCTLADLRALILNDSNLVVYDSGGLLMGRNISAFNPAESRYNYRIGDFYGSFPRDMVSAFAPIGAGFRHYGYLVLCQSTAVADARANDYMRQAYLIYILIFLLLLLILALIRRWVLQPVRRITEGAREFAAGNLEHRIRLSSEDELGYLARSLNDLASQLQSNDEAQRKFIANVAHDFRSPLTSIKGYLEAMVDGVIPPENQEKYMNIIIGETERLTNLTQSMLSLNSLDEARMGLELSRFDIVALIRSVCETFEGVCGKRGISFDLIFGAPQIPVRADYGRIGQALHNLIDNAIKFSYDDGLIRIRVQELGEKAAVSVKDFGQGIAKEDLGKIWTRFFKADASRGKDKRGTGLGLSIVKEIITAHGETIDVVSTPGSGTEFTFRLPLAKSGDA